MNVHQPITKQKVLGIRTNQELRQLYKNTLSGIGYQPGKISPVVVCD
jgi:hypothetical protein